MHPRTSHFSQLPYAIRVSPSETTDGGSCYFAHVVELEGCESHGATPPEAIENLREAMKDYIDSMLEDGLEPPEPVGAARLLVLEVMDGSPAPSATNTLAAERVLGDVVSV